MDTTDKGVDVHGGAQDSMEILVLILLISGEPYVICRRGGLNDESRAIDKQKKWRDDY